MTIHYCYRTTNKLTGEFYIGKRTTRQFDNWYDDPYLGSGTRLNRAIKKHGKDNFHKVILCYAETREENAANEVLFIGDQWKLSECYNLKAGGEGGAVPGHSVSTETRQKLSKKKMGQNNPNYGGKSMSEKTKRKLSDFNRGKTLTEEHKRKIGEACKGRPKSEEHRRKLSESLKGKKRVEKLEDLK